MIKNKMCQFFTTISLSKGNLDEEFNFLEDFLYEIPHLLSDEISSGKKRILSEVNEKYHSSFELNDFGELHLFGELDDTGSCFSFHGDEWYNLANVRHLALTIQAYFRKFNPRGFHGFECFSEDEDGLLASRESFLVTVTANNIEFLPLKDIIEEKRKKHELCSQSR